MKEDNTMEIKKFSVGFMEDIGNILEFCRDNETDNVSLEIDVGGHTLVVDIQFKIMRRGAEE